MHSAKLFSNKHLLLFLFAFAFLFEYATNYWFLHLTKEPPVQPSYSLIHMLHLDD